MPFERHVFDPCRCLDDSVLPPPTTTYRLQARDDLIDCATLYDTLDLLRRDVGAHCLTTRTQHLLMCRTAEQRQAFVDAHKYFIVKKRVRVVCGRDAVHCAFYRKDKRYLRVRGGRHRVG